MKNTQDKGKKYIKNTEDSQDILGASIFKTKILTFTDRRRNKLKTVFWQLEPRKLGNEFGAIQFKGVA